MALTNLGLFFLYFYYNLGYVDKICPHPANYTCGKTPVCTIYNGTACNSTVGFCQRQNLNDCAPCTSKDTVSYYPGRCSEAPLHVCDNNQRNVTACPAVFQPVCGFTYTRADRSVQNKTFSNGCSACRQSNIGFYTVGACDLEYIVSNTTNAQGQRVKLLQLVNENAVAGSTNYETETNNTFTYAQADDFRQSKVELNVTIVANGTWYAKVGTSGKSGSSSASQTVPKNVTKVPVAPVAAVNGTK